MASKSLKLQSSSSQYLSITDASQTGLDLSGDFTMLGSFYPDSLTGDHFIINKGQFHNSSQQYLWWIQSNGAVVLRVSDNGSNTSGNAITWTSTAGDIVAGQYQDISVRLDISTDSAYLRIDGVNKTFSKTSGSTIGASLYDGSEKVIIGARENSGSISSYYNGLVANFRIFSSYLSDSEIDAEHASTEAVISSNLELELRFDGNTNDSSSNSNNLTNNNSATFVNKNPLFPIKFDTSGSNNTGGTPSSVTYTATLGSDATILIVGVSNNSTSSSQISSVTYGGSTMTSIRRDVGSTGAGVGTIETFYLVNPPTGSNSIVITQGATKSSYVTSVWSSYEGVNTSDPIDVNSFANTAAAAGWSATTTTTESETVGVFPVFSQRNLTANSNMIIRHNSGSSYVIGETDGYISPAGSTASSLNVSSSPWTTWGHAVYLKPELGPSTPTFTPKVIFI